MRNDCVILIGKSGTKYNCGIRKISQVEIIFVCEPNSSLKEHLNNVEYIRFCSIDAYKYFDSLNNNPLIGICKLMEIKSTPHEMILICKLLDRNREAVQKDSTTKYMNHIAIQRTIECIALRNPAYK